jgi:hypothetical protein
MKVRELLLAIKFLTIVFAATSALDSASENAVRPTGGW